MTCKTDCGRCVYCTEHDDYGPAWRNPRFQAATSALGGHAGTETRERDENVHAPALTADGFTAALRALGRDGGESA